MHFMAKCLKPGEGKMFENWSRDLVDWKWEHMGDFLQKLVEVWGTMRRRYDLIKMGTEKEWKDEFALIQRVRSYLDDTIIEGYIIALKAVTWCGDRRGTWCEGCACHADELMAGQAVECVWRGRRGNEIAALGMQRCFGNLQD